MPEARVITANNSRDEGVIVRWYASAAEAEFGRPFMSASANRVRIDLDLRHGDDLRQLAEDVDAAWRLHEKLAAGDTGAGLSAATHKSWPINPEPQKHRAIEPLDGARA